MKDDRIEEHIIDIKEDIVEIKIDLKEHMRRTDVLEKLHLDNQSRILILEEPKKARAYIYEGLIQLGKILGVALTIAAVVKLSL